MSEQKVIRDAYCIMSGGCSQADPKPGHAGNLREFGVGETIFLTEDAAKALQKSDANPAGLELKRLEGVPSIEVVVELADVNEAAIAPLEELAAAAAAPPPVAPVAPVAPPSFVRSDDE
ncbi:MAG TPA: hypothetical protein VFD92_04580 [Candidatus Binatia bacterium]|nr:hypothetical protein [Candidatus Binatia bacterium]